MNILQNIFIDHYEEMIYTLHPRESVIENVEKMIHCGDSSFGGAMYVCPDCNEWKFVPFRCHSRFCPTCGNMYAIDRTTAMSFKLIYQTHRHCVFTIPEELRHFFFEDRSLLDCLFAAVRSVIFRMFQQLGKYKNYTPGIICVLHTFGRSLQWNPHIHCLITEGGVDDNGFWKKQSHFSYKLLRYSFRTALLNLLHERIGDSFKKWKAYIYKHCPNGFYIYAKPSLLEVEKAAKYIGRYLGRPVIATSRIDYYDEDNVIFHYNRHEDDVLVTEVLPAMEFIERLIQHIPEKHFKMIRYYGIYARHRKSDEKLFKVIPKGFHKISLDFNKWRMSIITSFGYDPLQCPNCGQNMKILEIYYNHRSVSLQELYERAMRKNRCRSPSKKVSHRSCP